ncbi:MAG TPA: SbcC/MukB-like Walker B domain-containing protein, partial [Tepidiformaceae bacterium]|nr:SbcC/MukB-like Walker B domain-containing protein [Tepidiformaceae bacterium]
SRQRDELRARYDRARSAKAAALDEADELTARATTLRDQVSRREAALRERERDVHARLTAARQAEGAIAPLRDALAAVVQVLESGAFASDARASREDAAGRLARLGYEAAAHSAIREQLRQGADVEEAYRQLLVAEERAAAVESRISDERTEVASRREELASAEQRLVAARDALLMAEDVTPRLREAQADLDALRGRESDLVLRMGQAQARRDALIELASRLEAAQETMNARKEEEGVYGDLAKAFGRDGVQAMLIDQSLPRVEYTANDMLDRMTGGRIHVSLATQRTLASGRVTETLDIRISDEVGTRDYEMYSGGEAFRVDLALRIALARLLAERAGATLPTLIIDEGFGTQDAEGIDGLIQSITAIQDEFRLILVVTHIDELKERFERRIEVTKAPDRGSLARVL